MYLVFFCTWQMHMWFNMPSVKTTSYLHAHVFSYAFFRTAFWMCVNKVVSVLFCSTVCEKSELFLSEMSCLVLWSVLNASSCIYICLVGSTNKVAAITSEYWGSVLTCRSSKALMPNQGYLYHKGHLCNTRGYMEILWSILSNLEKLKLQIDV